MGELRSFSSRCAFEMADQISASGYEVLAFQTTPGLFKGTFCIREIEQGLILGITTNVGLRFTGQRNMAVTSFASVLDGEGFWQDHSTKFPVVAGYNLTEEGCNWGMGPTDEEPICQFGAVLFKRQNVIDLATARYPRALEIIKATNYCTADLFRHTQFADEVNHQYEGNRARVDLMQMGLSMLETATNHVTLEVFNPTEAQVNKQLAGFNKRIAAGEDITAELMAAELHIDPRDLRSSIKRLTALTPRDWITAIRSETVLQLLLDPIKRRSRSIGDTIKEVAEFVHWDARTVRRNLEGKTGVKAGELLRSS